MAEYGVDIALRVTGEERLNKVLRAVGQLETRMKSIKAIDITAPGVGKLGDDIRKALAPFRDLARESINTGKGLKNTQARMQAVAESFRFLSANARIGTADFKNFTIAADNQARALQKVALEQENVIRSARGMQSVEERQIQLAKRQTLLTTLRRQRDAGFGMQGPALPPRQAPLPPTFASRIGGRLPGALSGAAIGGAFPLLFGQGPGAAAGGGIGGLLGGLLPVPGGAFAGSLVGTLLGDIASQGQKVKELAADVGFSAQQTKILSDAFKTANTDIEKFTAVIQNVRGLGLSIEDQGRAIELVTALTDKYGGSFEKVGNAITSVLESGKVGQANLNQLTSQGIDIQGALADKYKTNREAILKMAKDGKISVQSFIDTLVDMGNEGESAANRQTSAMDNLRNSVEKLVAATTQAIKSIGQTLGPVFDWLKGRVEDFINALSRAISRLADLISGGKMLQANIRAETAAQQATTRKFGVFGGIRAFNPAAEAFFQAERQRQLKLAVPGAFPKATTTQLQTFKAPVQAAAGGSAGGAGAKKEKEIKDITAQELNLRIQLLQAQTAQNKELEAFYERQLSLLKINQQKIGQNEREAQIFEVMVKYTQTMRDLERERTEELATKTLESVTKLSEGYTANINALKELNNQQLQQQNLAEGIAGTLGQTMTSAFEALVIGAESFNASLRGIASGVLIEIANQLLRIYIIEQAISTLRTFLSPISGGGIPGYGQGAVATGAFGISSGGFGGPSVAGIPLGPFTGGTFGVRAAGGPVSAGSPYLVGERGPELFMPRTSGSIYPNDAMGMGGANIVVNVDAGGSSVGGDPGQANQLGKAIGIAVQQELIKQKRPGGLLA